MNVPTPETLAALYCETEAACKEAMLAGVLPRDIQATWPNALGFMRRVPGQPLHREPPAGSADDMPSDAELVAFRDALKIHRRRALNVLRSETTMTTTTEREPHSSVCNRYVYGGDGPRCQCGWTWGAHRSTDDLCPDGNAHFTAQKSTQGESDVSPSH